MSTDELLDAIAIGLIESAMPDVADPGRHVNDLERAHRELVSRHRRERVTGCSCRSCCTGYLDALNP